MKKKFQREGQSEGRPAGKGVAATQSPKSQVSRQTLAAEVTKAEEQERRRLAQVLHDDLQPLLVGARFHLCCLRRQNKEQSFQDALDKIDTIFCECLSVSRSLTTELSPRVLCDGGLLPALQWLAKSYGERHGLKVEVIAEEEIGIDDEAVRIALFQAARELLLNVVKHAHAKTVTLYLSRPKSGQTSLVVSDDGDGFDPAKIHERKAMIGGFGLRHLRERILCLGGSLQVESAPGKGSRFTLICRG